MDFEDFRKQKDVRVVLAEHELTDDELERLIENKFNRAMQYYNALSKREVELVEQD